MDEGQKAALDMEFRWLVGQALVDAGGNEERAWELLLQRLEAPELKAVRARLVGRVLAFPACPHCDAHNPPVLQRCAACHQPLT